MEGGKLIAEESGTRKCWRRLHDHILWHLRWLGNRPRVKIGKILLSYQKVPRLNSTFTQLFSF